MLSPDSAHLQRWLPVFKSILIFLLLFRISSYSHATSVTVSGNVSGTWNTDTVFVKGNLLIPYNESLNILPGIVVEFNAYYSLEVQGQLLAKGLPGDTIIFTVKDTVNFGNQSTGKGGWSGIRFKATANNSDSSIFSFCCFRFGKAVEDSTNSYGGAIQVKDFSKVRISDCLFYHNYSFYSGGAIYLWNSDIRLVRSVFRNNYSGNTGSVYGYGGGFCGMYSSPDLKENGFYENASTGIGGGVSFDGCNPVFNNNILINNRSALGGALGILRSSPGLPMANNLIMENEAEYFGGGICCIRSFPVFSNLTITGNESASGGGFYCNDSAVPSIYNSIIWGNTGFGKSVYIWDVRSAPNFYFSDIEGDTSNFEGSGGQEGFHGHYDNNINSDPLFSNSDSSLYYLLAGSPCIDKGMPDAGSLELPHTDLSGADRVYNNRIDMGVYEYHGTASVLNQNMRDHPVLVFPNPFNNQTIITLPQIVKNATEIYISDLQGTLIRRMQLMPQNTSIIWDGRDDRGYELPNGIYLLNVVSSEYFSPVKVVKGDL